jgi:hypothetical protein
MTYDCRTSLCICCVCVWEAAGAAETQTSTTLIQMYVCRMSVVLVDVSAVYVCAKQLERLIYRLVLHSV